MRFFPNAPGIRGKKLTVLNCIRTVLLPLEKFFESFSSPHRDSLMLAARATFASPAQVGKFVTTDELFLMQFLSYDHSAGFQKEVCQ
jgi:hypothetical protein